MATPIRLNGHDLVRCVRYLPPSVKNTMHTFGKRICIGGGYIRSVVCGEDVHDIDIFTNSKETAKEVAEYLRDSSAHLAMHESENAYTIKGKDLQIPVQVIHRWSFVDPKDVVYGFDFTICAAAIWYRGSVWDCHAHFDFYGDLAAKRLMYMFPQREEAAGGSLLRVLKFVRRGYTIPIESFGGVLSRLVLAVDFEKQLASLCAGERLTDRIGGRVLDLLKQVDPQIDDKIAVALDDEPCIVEATLSELKP